jgi:hypothetical protein
MSSQPECIRCGVYVHSGPVHCADCIDKIILSKRYDLHIMGEEIINLRQAINTQTEIISNIEDVIKYAGEFIAALEGDTIGASLMACNDVICDFSLCVALRRLRHTIAESQK